VLLDSLILHPFRAPRAMVPEAGIRSVAGSGVPSALLLLVSLALPSFASHLDAQEPVFPLDTLDVAVGSRVSPGLPTITRAVEVIDREQIAATPARNVAELLRWATAVDFMPRSPAQADVSIRGAGFEQVLVLVDGVRVSDRQTGHFDLDLAVPLDRVERVEILRGPGSALYGADAVGGVVNVVTRASGPRWEGRVEGGTFGSGAVALGGGFGESPDIAVHGGAELARSDGHRTGTDYETAVAHLRVAAPLRAGRLLAELGLADRGFGAEDFYGPYPAYEATRTWTAAARWSPPAGGRLRVEPGLSVRRHDDDFILRRDDPAFYRNLHTTWQAGGEVVARYADSGPWSLAFGAEGYRDVLESANLGDRSESRGAIFAEGSHQRGAATLSAGLRGDTHSTFGRFLSPSLAGAWAIRPELRLRASVGRAFRVPTWTERYYTDPANVGRADLGAERSWSAEVGAGYDPVPGVRMSAAFFRRASRDLIDWARPEGTLDTDGVPWETRNVENATTHGLEGEIALVEHVPEGTLVGPRARLSVGGSLLSLSSVEAPGFESKYALRPLTRQLHVAFVRPLTPGSDLAVRGLVGKRAAEPRFHQVDARFSARIGSMGAMGRATLHLDVTNVFDSRHDDIIGMPVAGRAFVAGISLSDGGAREPQAQRPR
jgi:vitamin B12 transporter